MQIVGGGDSVVVMTVLLVGLRETIEKTGFFEKLLRKRVSLRKLVSANAYLETRFLVLRKRVSLRNY
jgi:hypothetical protein